MFDFMDCSLFIVYLYDTCLIPPEKKLNIVWYHRKQKLNMVLDKLYKMKELKTKMRESGKLVLF